MEEKEIIGQFGHAHVYFGGNRTKFMFIPQVMSSNIKSDSYAVELDRHSLIKFSVFKG